MTYDGSTDAGGDGHDGDDNAGKLYHCLPCWLEWNLGMGVESGRVFAMHRLLCNWGIILVVLENAFL